MRVGIYARISTESQEARGTIGSQLELLRKRVAAEGHQLVAEYRDDGCSGCHIAPWTEKSGSRRRYCPLKREFPSPIVSNLRQ